MYLSFCTAIPQLTLTMVHKYEKMHGCLFYLMGYILHARIGTFLAITFKVLIMLFWSNAYHTIAEQGYELYQLIWMYGCYFNSICNSFWTVDYNNYSYTISKHGELENLTNTQPIIFSGHMPSVEKN